jgi:hypothetical protein
MQKVGSMIIEIQVLKDMIEYAEMMGADVIILKEPTSTTSTGYTILADMILRSQPKDVEKLKTPKRIHRDITVEIEPIYLTIDLKNGQPKLSTKIRVEKK